MSSPSVGSDQEREVAGPTPVVTLEMIGQDYSDSPNIQTMYNPSAIQIGGKMHLFVHSGTGDEFTQDNSYCWGDQIVLWTADADYEGLRSPFQLEGTVTACDPRCTDIGCNEPDRFLWGLGSVIQSQHDSQYYLSLDYLENGACFRAGDFKEVRQYESADGFNWQQSEVGGQPVRLLAQSNIQCETIFGPCTGSCTTSTTQGPCGSGGGTPPENTCMTISFVDVTLEPGPTYWWGYFSFGIQFADRFGMIRVYPDDPSPGSYKVEILAQDGTWRVVPATGKVDFMPMAAGFGQVNDIVPNATGTGYEVWGHSAAFEATAGCDEGLPNNSSKFIRYELDEIHGELTQSSRKVVLPSDVRPSASINATGRLFPAVVFDEDDNKLLYSASSDTICQQVPSWPPGDNTFVGMDIVLTEISSAEIKDGFSVTGSRTEGSALNGSSSEIGGEIWAVLNAPLNIRSGWASNEGQAGDRAGAVPYQLAAPRVRVEAIFEANGADWVGIGFGSSTVQPLLSSGQVWALITPGGAWELFYAGSMISSGTATINPSEVALAIELRETEGLIDVFVDNMRVASVAAPSSPSLNINSAAFQFFDPSPDLPGTTRVDRFKVIEGPAATFSDGFESRTTENWTRVP